MNITKLILVAQKKLISKPYDLAHDLLHHNRVAEYVLFIKNKEDIECDPGLLIVSAWLHDVFGRSPKDLRKLRTLISKYIRDREKVEVVVNAINEHSFGKTPASMYGKILYDADKLEYVNIHRLSNFLQIYRDKYLSYIKFVNYIKEWEMRIENVYNSLHFNTTKKLFTQMLPKAREIMKEARQTAKV